MQNLLDLALIKADIRASGHVLNDVEQYSKEGMPTGMFERMKKWGGKVSKIH